MAGITRENAGHSERVSGKRKFTASFPLSRMYPSPNPLKREERECKPLCRQTDTVHSNSAAISRGQCHTHRYPNSGETQHLRVRHRYTLSVSSVSDSAKRQRKRERMRASIAARMSAFSDFQSINLQLLQHRHPFSSYGQASGNCRLAQNVAFLTGYEREMLKETENATNKSVSCVLTVICFCWRWFGCPHHTVQKHQTADGVSRTRQNW